jgi:membrane protease YdiL (CAAX protease family)
VKKFGLTAIRIIIYIIVYLIGVGVFQFLSAYLAGIDFFEAKSFNDVEFLVINFGGLIGTLFVTYLFTRFIDKIPFVKIGLQTQRAVKDFGLGALLGFLPILFGFTILYLMKIIHSVDVYFDTTGLITSVLLFIFVAFNEEIMLRGYVLRNLMNTTNKYTALILSAILFALLHIFNAHIDLIGFINIFLAGILLGISYIFTKNLFFPAGLHFAWNLTQSLLGFNVSGNNSYSLLHYELSKDKPWLSGGAFGFEASILSLVFELILIVIIFFIFHKRQKNTF